MRYKLGPCPVCGGEAVTPPFKDKVRCSNDLCHLYLEVLYPDAWNALSEQRAQLDEARQQHNVCHAALIETHAEVETLRGQLQKHGIDWARDWHYINEHVALLTEDYCRAWRVHRNFAKYVKKAKVWRKKARGLKTIEDLKLTVNALEAENLRLRAETEDNTELFLVTHLDGQAKGQEAARETIKRLRAALQEIANSDKVDVCVRSEAKVGGCIDRTWEEQLGRWAKIEQKALKGKE